jgi:hypothetical protein
MPPPNEPGPLGEETFWENNPDPLGNASHAAGVWGNPTLSPAGIQDVPAHLPGDYGAEYASGFVRGLVTPFQGDDTTYAQPPARLIARTDYERKTWEAPHEATHRRYDPPRMVNISQTASGFSLLLPTNPGLHYIKLIACMITLDAAGTLQFVQGDNAGLSTAPISGTMNLGTAGGFVLPPAEIATPWLFTSSDLALGIFTVTGKAQGFAVVCYSPYDQ